MAPAASRHTEPTSEKFGDLHLPETDAYQRLRNLRDPEFEKLKAGCMYDFASSLIRCPVPFAVQAAMERGTGQKVRGSLLAHSGQRQATFSVRSEEVLPELKVQFALQKRAYFHERITSEYVAITSRLRNGLAQTLNCFVERDQSVLLMPPCFGGYERVVAWAGLNVERVPLQTEDSMNFTPNMPKIIERLHDPHAKVRAVLAAHPNNPTGESFSPSDLETLQKETERCGCLLVIDDTFEAFNNGEVIPQLKSNNVIYLGSFGESYGLPRDQVEMGYVVARPTIIRRIETMTVLDPPAKPLEQEIALSALSSHEEHLESILPLLRSNQAFVRNQVQLHLDGVRCGSGTTLPFVYLYSPSFVAPKQIAVELAKSVGIAVAPSTDFGGFRGLRIGVGELIDIEKFQTGVRKMVEALKKIVVSQRRSLACHADLLR